MNFQLCIAYIKDQLSLFVCSHYKREIHTEVPWHALSANDILLVDKTRARINTKLRWKKRPSQQDYSEYIGLKRLCIV